MTQMPLIGLPAALVTRPEMPPYRARGASLRRSARGRRRAAAGLTIPATPVGNPRPPDPPTAGSGGWRNVTGATRVSWPPVTTARLVPTPSTAGRAQPRKLSEYPPGDKPAMKYSPLADVLAVAAVGTPATPAALSLAITWRVALTHTPASGRP